MKTQQRGFTLIELIAVMILIGIISVTLFSRVGSVGTAAVQSGRDDLIAALFFAQQTAMMRPDITLVISTNSVSVNENGLPIAGTHYPLTLPAGVALNVVGTLSPAGTLTYDKLGRTTETTFTLTGSGNSSGVSASVKVETSGYAFAN